MSKSEDIMGCVERYGDCRELAGGCVEAVSTRSAEQHNAEAEVHRDAIARLLPALECAEAIAEAVHELVAETLLETAYDEHGDPIGYILTTDDYHNLRALVGAWERAKAAEQVK